MSTSGSFSFDNSPSIDAVHETLKDAVEATNENSKFVNRLSKAAIILAIVQTLAAIVQGAAVIQT